jgi:hypothetical protein
MANRAIAATPTSRSKVRSGQGSGQEQQPGRSADAPRRDSARRNPHASDQRINVTAAHIGSTLGHLVGRVDAWAKQRHELASELQKIVRTAHGMLADLGGFGSARKARGKRGRVKTAAMPDETNVRLRAAAERRQRESSGRTSRKPADVRSTIRATDGRHFTARQSGKG